MSTINKTRLKQWIKALRSNNYEQGTGSLRTAAGEYCCLGVVCELAEVPANFDQGQWKFGVDGAMGLLPTEAVRWLFKDFTPEEEEKFARFAADPDTVAEANLMIVRPARVGERLATVLNDADKMTFSEIADALEEAEEVRLHW